ncbi:DUF1659 domain-containing protein [Romboutsia sp.]|uniref:DUF1659 domain-containing protein n=1 Tax=Romboutsia sp. TaxID=1965302 RepID=UPI003F399A2A
MAVVVTSNPTGLKIKLNLGNDPITGRVITKSKTYSNLSPEAADQDIFDVANVIGSLQKYPIVEVARIDNSTLSA